MPDVDLDEIAQKIFFGAFFNTAQICVATKRLYVHEDVYEGLRDRLLGIAKAIKVGDGAEQGTVLGPIQNKRQYARVLELLEDAKKTGLTVLQGADVPEGGYFIPVTIVEMQQDALDRGLGVIRKNYDASAAKGRFKPEQVEQMMGLLTPTLALVDLADALAKIGEDVMAGYSPEQAIREYLRRGSQQRPGLEELMRRVSQRREEILARSNLGGSLQQVKELLDKAVLEERKSLARALDDDARFAEMRIENLPPSPAQAVSVAEARRNAVLLDDPS